MNIQGQVEGRAPIEKEKWQRHSPFPSEISDRFFLFTQVWYFRLPARFRLTHLTQVQHSDREEITSTSTARKLPARVPIMFKNM